MTIEKLAQLIQRYQRSYYTDEAEISDAEFDSLWDELKQRDPSHPLLQKIGSDIIETHIQTKIQRNNFEKARHLIPMGSQEKAANPEDFVQWANKMSFTEFLVEYKLDGASLELQYENGRFLKAVTRGDGEIGDDITKNVLKMKGLVKNLYKPDGSLYQLTGGVRGEVIMSHVVHKTYFSDKANCRNAANGLMKRKDGSGSEHLQIICYDAFFQDSSIKPFLDEEKKLDWLSTCGFDTVPFKKCSGALQVVEYRAQVMEMREGLDYDIDGLVVKGRDIDKEDAKRRRPEKQIAFKFSLEEAVTIVRSIIWSESGVTYTPIAEFDTVELAGTQVQRASLVNPNTIKALGVKIGSHVVVTKRGEIIPKIEYVIQHNSPQKEAAQLSMFSESELEISIPSLCSVCNTKLINDGTRLYCPNKTCPKLIHHRLEKWVSVLDIRDLGLTLIKRLFETEKVRSIKDFYTLTEEDLTPYFLNSESIGKDKESLGAKKVIASIQATRTISLSSFIAGFDIEGIGETLVEKLLVAGFTTLHSLLNASCEDFSKVNGFGDIMAQVLYEGLREHSDEMLYLTESGIITIQSNATGVLTGLSFCFTGELYTMKRSDAEVLVKRNGGTTKSSVVKDLSYLVTNDTASGSSKNKKALAFGVPIINEDQFLALAEF